MRSFRAMWRNDDVRKYRVTRQVLEGRHRWLEEEVIAFDEPGEMPEPPAEREPEASRRLG